ncbi:hypothetical protein [Ralstonia pseudosolanacearum]|uniref:hypothetical protein n=1 Tax=Ralstonia pseudosolanacearum TaxID=1310165 RepID=UPI000AEDA1F6|nr:hypothetical protein [Ralstonia pseudosolanacearum]
MVDAVDFPVDSCSAFQFNLKSVLNYRAFIPYHWIPVDQALEFNECQNYHPLKSLQFLLRSASAHFMSQRMDKT